MFSFIVKIKNELIGIASTLQEERILPSLANPLANSNNNNNNNDNKKFNNECFYRTETTQLSCWPT